MNIEMHVLAPISFYGEVFKTRYDVEKAIKECETGIREAEDALVKLVYMTDPRKFIPEDSEQSPEEWLDERIGAIKHDLQVGYVDLYKYKLILEMWSDFHMKDKNGVERTVTLPENMRKEKPIWEHAYAEGDWIDIVYPDGSEVEDD